MLNQSELTALEPPLPRQARALATRERLLDATIDVLVEAGYAGATTQAVCRRAGVSRGTLLHHFGTRAELLVASLEHVLRRVVSDFVQARLAAPPVGVDALLALMWEQWRGPALTAWLELAVAARTDPALRAPMREVMLGFDQLISAAFSQLAPTDRLDPALRAGAPFFVFAVLNGLAVGRCYEAEGQSQPVLDLLTRLAVETAGPEESP